MKKIVLFSLLSASITFNIAFVVAFIFRPAHPAGLQFGQKNREGHHFLEDQKLQVRKQHREILKTKKDFFKYLSDENFDEVIARQKIDNIISKQKELETKIGEGLIKFRNTNGAEEYNKMFKRCLAPQRLKNKKRGEKRWNDLSY